MTAAPIDRASAQAVHAQSAARSPGRTLNPVRVWLMCLGLVCVGLGAVGVVVPGLPTTVFLIIASWCFTRSCPWLERKLIRNRFFGPFVRFMEPGAVMPTRARVVSTVLLLGAVTPSVMMLLERDITVFVPVIVAVSGVVGTAAIWLVARPKPVPVNAPARSSADA